MIGLEHRDLVARAVARFETGKADFSDYLIGERALAAGARTTLSFDEDACSCDLFESVECAESLRQRYGELRSVVNGAGVANASRQWPMAFSNAEELDQ